MRKFKSPKYRQQFLSRHGTIRNLFYVSRYTKSAAEYRDRLKTVFKMWDDIILQENYT